jgi:hypothetical protein
MTGLLSFRYPWMYSTFLSGACRCVAFSFRRDEFVNLWSSDSKSGLIGPRKRRTVRDTIEPDELYLASRGEQAVNPGPGRAARKTARSFRVELEARPAPR